MRERCDKLLSEGGLGKSKCNGGFLYRRINGVLNDLHFIITYRNFMLLQDVKDCRF